MGDSGALVGAALAPRSCPSPAATTALRCAEAAACDGPHNRQPSQPSSSLPHSSTTPPRSTPLRRAGRTWQGGSASPGHGSGFTWCLTAPPSLAQLLPARRPSCAQLLRAPPLLPPPAGGAGFALPGSRSGHPRLVAASSLLVRLLPIWRPPCLRGRTWELTGAPHPPLPPTCRLPGGARSTLPGSGSSPLRLVVASSPIYIMAPLELRVHLGGVWG